MRTNEEDLDVEEGIEYYQNGKLARQHEKLLTKDFKLLTSLVNKALKENCEEVATDLFSAVVSVKDVVLGGEFNQGKTGDFTNLLQYPEGFAEFQAIMAGGSSVVMVIIRWADEYVSYSHT